MTKWADYAITAVRYNSNHTHIIQVVQRTDIGEKIVSPETVDRSIVVGNLKYGKTYVTAYKNKENQWVKGEHVHIDPMNSGTYITTDPNNKTVDNLGELPEF